MPTPAPIQPRQPDVVQASRLPSKKELVDPDEVAGVEYGTTARLLQEEQLRRLVQMLLKLISIHQQLVVQRVG